MDNNKQEITNIELIQKQNIWAQMKEYKKETIDQKQEIEELNQKHKETLDLNLYLFNTILSLSSSLLKEFGVYTVKENNDLIIKEIKIVDLDLRHKIQQIKNYTIKESLLIINLLRKFIVQNEVIIDRIKNKTEKSIDDLKILEYFESQTIEFDKLQDLQQNESSLIENNKKLGQEIIELNTRNDLNTELINAKNKQVEELKKKIRQKEKIINKHSLNNLKNEQMENVVNLNKALNKEIMDLKIRFCNIPDYIIQNSFEYKKILIELDLIKAKNIELSTKVLKQKAKKDEILSEITKLRSINDEYKTNLLKETNKNIIKMQNDIVRIRKNRDELQIALNNNGKTTTLLQDKNELQIQRKINKNQRVRIKSLRNEINRQKAIINSNNVDYTQHYIQSVDSNIKDIANEVETLKLILNSSYRDVDLLENVNNDVESSPKTTEPNLKTTASPSELDSLKNEILKLKQTNDLLTKTEAQLIQQLENVGEAYQLLEEQLTAKEDIIEKLNTEVETTINQKYKIEQKYLANTRQIYQLDKMNKLNTNKYIKQADLVASLNKRIHNIMLQIDTLTGLNSALNHDLVKANEELLLKNSLIDVLNQRVLDVDQKYTNANATLHELLTKYNQSDHGIALISQSPNKNTDSLLTISKLQEEVKDYKKLLKCPSCDLNFKSHVLLRCMHVFCKQCIDNRVDTRQRKCPSCNESFGINDIKQIYL